MAIAVEGELKTSDGKLMGRLDLLMADVDDAETWSVGWLRSKLQSTPRRIKTRSQSATDYIGIFCKVITQTGLQSVLKVGIRQTRPNGPPWRQCLEAAYETWNATQPTKIPLDADPGESTCGVFVIESMAALIGGIGAEQYIAQRRFF